MPTENITIRERLLLHLSRFPEYSPDEIYNIPFDLTQDGIASVLGISRAHASLELKKLRETEKVYEWLAHIKSSGSKRKAYCLSPDGMRDANLLKERFISEGVSIGSLLDMKRCDPNVMWDALSTEDRETFGLACTFREPIPRRTIPDTNTGIIPADFEGMVRISEEVRRKYLGVASKEKIKDWHSRAADWYVDNGGNEQEKLFHLSSAGRDTEATKLLIKNAENFIENPNEDLLEIVKNIKVPPKYNETVLGIRAVIALDCLNTQDAEFCADRLEEYGSIDSTIIRSESNMINNDPYKAYERSIEAYKSSQTPSLALVTAKALFKMKKYDEAEKFISEAIKTFTDSGDVSHLDEIMVLRAGIAHAHGKNDDCISYLNKALRSCRKDSYRSKIKDIISSINDGKDDVRFL